MNSRNKSRVPVGGMDRKHAVTIYPVLFYYLVNGRYRVAMALLHKKDSTKPLLFHIIVINNI